MRDAKRHESDGFKVLIGREKAAACLGTGMTNGFRSEWYT